MRGEKQIEGKTDKGKKKQDWMIWEFLSLPRWHKMLKLKESHSGKGALEKKPRVWLYYIWLIEQEAQIFRFENSVKKGSLKKKKKKKPFD